MISLQQERKRIQQLISLDNQTDRESDQYYDEAMSFIQQHLLQFYQQYADQNGLSLQQASANVNKWDLAQWQQAVDTMDMSDWPQEATARAKVYGAMAGIDKTHLLGAIIGLGILRMTVKNQHNIGHRIDLDTATEARRMEQGYELSDAQSRRVNNVITKYSREQPWSKNLWSDSDTMTNDVVNLVNKQLRSTMTPQDLADLITAHTNPSQFKPNASIADRIKQETYNARRLVRTESARMVNNINMAAYKEKGVKAVNWVNEPGACPICIDLAEGGPYPIDDAPLVPDSSHPNCRCHLTPVMMSRQAVI